MNNSRGAPARPEETATSVWRADSPAGRTTLSVPPRGGADRSRWRALAVSLVAACMALLDVSIVNVAVR